MTISTLPDSRSLEQRRVILKMTDASRRGHIASALSILEIVRVLYDSVLRVDPANPSWKDRDRFILSKGHGCMALYLLLAERGFFPYDELFRFTKFDSILGSHPDLEKVPGCEASTGSLGHGLPIGVGLALAARLEKASWRVFVLVGDGECQEGTTWEAAVVASKHRLDHLAVLVDSNKMQCFSTVREVGDLEPFADKWRAFGFAVREVDGHDPVALLEALEALPYEAGRPSCLICHTVKGKGVLRMEGSPAWHHANRVSDEEMRGLYEDLEEVARASHLS